MWHIVLVEDNPADVVLVREVIHGEKLQAKLLIFTEGESALAFINNIEEDADMPRPNLFLLDLNLPKVDGFVLLNSIRNGEKYKTIPVIVFSSSDSPHDSTKAVQLGASFFRKPFSLDEYFALGPVLRRALEPSLPTGFVTKSLENEGIVG
ncbi:MAG TPA: response regulator [Bryobacteraceae bacterium]|nr:response regulator [Bryobacteraceae bacterium]